MKKGVSFLLASFTLVSLTACNQNKITTNTNIENEAVNSFRTGKGLLKEQNNRTFESSPEEILVALDLETVRTSTLSTLSNKYKAEVIDEIPELGVALLKVPQRTSSSVMKSLNKDPNVKAAGKNYVFRTLANINDPMANEQYALNNVQARKAWDITKGKSGVTIAIVDTGIDLNHPDLQSKLVPGFSALRKDKKANNADYLLKGGDDNGHGTHCAGIAAGIGNNGKGIAGIALNNKIMPVRVLGGAGSGSMFSIAKGISWAADHGAKVISLSLGGPSSIMDLVVERAIKKAIRKDAIMVVAAGNSGKEEYMNPAIYAKKYKEVVAVSATDINDRKANFSTWGDHITVSAPGVDILSTLPTYPVYITENYGKKKSYDKLSGTSMSTPLVSGIVGLMRSKFPNLNAGQIKAKLQKSVDDVGDTGYDKLYGYGRVNAFKAVSN